MLFFEKNNLNLNSLSPLQLTNLSNNNKGKIGCKIQSEQIFFSVFFCTHY